MENLNNGESSSNGGIRSRIELLPKPQLVDFLCHLASKHPSIAQEIENLYNVTSHRKLYVTHLSSTTNSRTLRSAFQEYGEVEEAFVVRDKVTRKSKKYGFVTYKDVKSVNHALREPRKTIDGSVTICDVADERYMRTKISSYPDVSLGRKLYIGDLAEGVTSESLRSDFEKHGEIEEAVVMKMKRGGYGFVTYMTAEAAEKAIDEYTHHPTFAQGRKRIVKYANPRRGRRGLSRNPSPEYEQFEDDYVDSHSSVPPTHSPYETYGVVYYPQYYYPYQ